MPSEKENKTTDVVKAAPKKKTTRKKKEVAETPVETVETTEFDLECSNGKGEDE